ncbi:MAG: ATP phosphoribosyltransferase regulatory subunit, partial [Spirochaetota bacterium]
MKNDIRTRLQIPQGTEAFYVDEARRHHLLRDRLAERFRLWGYLPVQTPVMDFYDVYRDLLGERDARAIYRLVDREGDLLMLRSDVTLFLAKQMGLILRPEDLPIRVWYSDTILRHQDPDDISRNEFHQSGVELIGLTGQEAELEVMALLSEILRNESPSTFFLHVGSRRLINLLCPAGDPRHTLIRALAFRDVPKIVESLRQGGHDASAADRLARLLLFIGSPEEARGLRKQLTLMDSRHDAAFAEVEAVAAAVSSLAAVGHPQGRVDFSEVASQPYYSGIVFQVYLEGLDAPVASGGRYDGLLGFFGSDAPSVGFSIMLRKLEARLAADASPTPPEAAVKASGDDFSARYRDAERKRSAGEVTVL